MSRVNPLVWIRFDPTNWIREGGGTSFNEEEVVQRAYLHWSHADRLCENATSEFTRTDIVTTLKRAVNQRVRLLRDSYSIREIQRTLQWKTAGDLDTFARLDLIRPLMLNRLNAIRNAVEHEDISPPTVSECRDLVEFVWYFLRSTDALAREMSDNFDIRPDAAPTLVPRVDLDASEEEFAAFMSKVGQPRGTSACITYLTGTGLPKFYGHFLPDEISERPRDDWCAVHLTRDESSFESLRSLAGEIRGPRELLTRLWVHYFSRRW